MRGISGVAEDLSSSQERLCSMESVSYLVIYERSLYSLLQITYIVLLLHLQYFEYWQKHCPGKFLNVAFLNCSVTTLRSVILQRCVSINVHVILRISARPYRQHACQRNDYLVNVDFSIHYVGTRDDGRSVPKYVYHPYLY
jgi:hypothetical protein